MIIFLLLFLDVQIGKVTYSNQDNFSIQVDQHNDVLFYDTRLTEWVTGNNKKVDRTYLNNHNVSVRYVHDPNGFKVASRVIIDPIPLPKGYHECLKDCHCDETCVCDGVSCYTYSFDRKYILPGDPQNLKHRDND